MLTRHYDSYVSHAVRYYARITLWHRPRNPRFRNKADQENWEACDTVIRSYPEEQRRILLVIHRGGDTIPDNVYAYCEEHGVQQEVVWALIRDMRDKIAKRRGLV